MPTFAIQQGATPLCAWDLSTEVETVHERTVHREGMAVFEEAKRVAFVLSVAPEGVEHRIVIGDIPLGDLVPQQEDAAGLALGGQLFWRELPYFESARGRTNIVLEARSRAATQGKWETALSVFVYVLPSKLGEERYESMADDLQALNRSLLVDLYGKSLRGQDTRAAHSARKYHSRERELAAIHKVLAGLGPILSAIARRPASRVLAAPHWHRYWGSEHVSPGTIVALSRRAEALAEARRPIAIHAWRRMESFDISEHRSIRAFLDDLQFRARRCANAARGHIRAITSDRHLRHIRLGSGPTLYETLDLPRISRLQDGVRKAKQSHAIARTLGALPFLREAKSELVAVRGGAFQRSPEYRVALSLIRRFLLANPIWNEGDDMPAVTKLTSRLFEQWCYLRIVEAFRARGLELREWADTLRQNLRSRFVLDFDRGLMFEGALGRELRIRFRYEPWILGADSAGEAGETLCRGSATDVAWCPDIVVECLRRDGDAWRPVYGIVLDCKYAATVRSHHWNKTAKYLEIRSTETRRQIVRQLWLIVLGETPRLESEDPGVSFTDTGPTCEPDESVRFRMEVSPRSVIDQELDAPSSVSPFNRFATGTISFFRREFGVPDPRKST